MLLSDQVLQQRLGPQGDMQGDLIGGSIDRSPSGLPERERTMIGGDSQQEVIENSPTAFLVDENGKENSLKFDWLLGFQVLPTLVALQQEHEALNKALRAEQQLYSSLVRTVKEQDRWDRPHQENIIWICRFDVVVPTWEKKKCWTSFA